MALAAAIAALTLAAVPSLASAQSLNTAAIDTDSSGGFLVLDVNGASTPWSERTPACGST